MNRCLTGFLNLAELFLRNSSKKMKNMKKIENNGQKKWTISNNGQKKMDK